MMKRQALPWSRVANWCSIFILALYVLSGTGIVSALTQQDIHREGIHYFDLAGGVNCSDTATNLPGNSNQEKAFNYFVSKGLTSAQAAGIVGNLMQESGVNPKSTSGGGATIGIAQWEGDRDDALKAFAQKENKPYTDLGVQLDYLWQELTTSYATVLKNVQAATTYQDATNQFVGPDIYPSGAPAQPTYEGRRQGGFENPGTPMMSNRLGYAKTLFDNAGGSDSSSTSDASSTGSCGGNTLSPDCATAAGVAKILCAAKVYDPVSYSESAAGGHLGSAQAWHKTCPVVGPSCVLDCSGLVNIAVFDAFGTNLNENTDGERADIGKYWKKISLSEVQPGDLVQPNPGHVEIVDHVKGNKVYAFAAHTQNVAQPQQVGEWDNDPDIDGPGSLYLHYIGPGV